MTTFQPRRAGTAKQSGVMLLEALIALLVFSVGVLAIVAMQAAAFQDMGESKYRTDAAFLANQIIADMWSNSANLDSYVWDGAGAPPAVLEDWITTVDKRLPGTVKYRPTIERDAATNAMTVTVSWQQARDRTISAPAHSYKAVAYINCCN
jgi:type IV pilus assembly protein PilV